MPKVTAYSNTPDSTPEEQLVQVRLALQNIKQTVNGNRSILCLSSRDSTPISSSSSSPVTVQAFSFTPNTAMQLMTGSINLSSSGEAFFSIKLDGTVIYEMVVNDAAKKTYNFSMILSANPGTTHRLEYVFQGNITKHEGLNQIQINTQVI